jgi:hypothetical protein
MENRAPSPKRFNLLFLACSMAQHKINGTGWIGSDSRVATALFELMKTATVDSFYTTAPVYSLVFRPAPPRQPSLLKLLATCDLLVFMAY